MAAATQTSFAVDAILELNRCCPAAYAPDCCRCINPESHPKRLRKSARVTCKTAFLQSNQQAQITNGLREFSGECFCFCLCFCCAQATSKTKCMPELNHSAKSSGQRFHRRTCVPFTHQIKGVLPGSAWEGLGSGMPQPKSFGMVSSFEASAFSQVNSFPV